jgi:hypothetical protein
MKILIIIGLLVGLTAAAPLPSDLIHKGNYTEPLDLSGTAPASAKAIDALNPDLSTYVPWFIPMYGKYQSELPVDNATQSILDWAKKTPPIPTMAAPIG